MGIVFVKTHYSFSIVIPENSSNSSFVGFGVCRSISVKFEGPLRSGCQAMGMVILFGPPTFGLQMVRGILGPRR